MVFTVTKEQLNLTSRIHNSQLKALDKNEVVKKCNKFEKMHYQ